MEIIELNGPIDSWGCQTNWIKYNLNRNKGKEVTLRINCPGGVVNEALTIAQAIKDHGKVTALLYGCCASAATFLCLSANKVQIAKDAMWMCHNCSMLLSVYKNMKVEDLGKIIKELTSQKKTQEAFDLNIARMYAAKSGKELDQIQSLMAEERWMNAEEVKEWGFVDEVVEGSIPMSDVAKAQMLQNCASFNLPVPNIKNEIETSEESLIDRIINKCKEIFAPKAAADDDGDGNIIDEHIVEPKKNEGMKKIINSVVCFLALFNMKEIEATDDKVSLTVDQLNTLETALADAKKVKDEVADVVKALDDISDDIKSIDGVKNKVNALKAILNRTPAYAPAAAPVPAEPKTAKNDGEDEVNHFFD